MMERVRPIDANKLVRWFEGSRSDVNPMNCDAREAYHECIAMVEAMETLDAEPVRHGRWERRLNKYYCTSCGTGYRICNGGPNAFRFKRCPNCGAKMDAKEDTQNDQS